MALHAGIARHAESFGARTVWNATNAYSSGRPSPSQFPSDLSYKPNQGRHSVGSVFSSLIANERAVRRA